MALAVYFALLFTVISQSLAVDQYRIGAFNVQKFGQEKAQEVDVMNILAKLITRYDLILIQEIRDAEGKAFPKLMEQINNADFKYVQSERLGRSDSKEQYAFVYNSKVFSVNKQYQYPDKKDFFERPPYCTYFTVNDPGTALSAFGACGIRIQSSDAVNEMNHLPKVYDAAVSEFGSENIIIMGDFHGDCRYVKESDWPNISLRTNNTFAWKIEDSIDSAVAELKSCAYDRIVVAGEQLKKAVVRSGKAFRFDKFYKLAEKQTKKVSDHFPVEMMLYKDLPSSRRSPVM